MTASNDWSWQRWWFLEDITNSLPEISKGFDHILATEFNLPHQTPIMSNVIFDDIADTAEDWSSRE